jgi:hypothetical protein
LEVTDAIEVLNRARSAGFPLLSTASVIVDSGVNQECIAAYLSDPDGYFVEIGQRPAVNATLAKK